jgi:hypothetical protein
LPTDLLAFYRGGRDTEGRTLDQILAWDDVELEYVHDYIQWLFPTTRRSAFNPVAPVLTDEVISFFRRDGALRDRLLAAFDRMLRFYGFVRVKGAVERGPAWARRSREWLAPGDHNLRRITRILDSLSTLGLGDEARAFLRALEALDERERRAIGPLTYRYWREATR